MRLFRTATTLLISVLPLSTGAAQSMTWTPLPVLGGDADDRERLGQLLGGPRREGFLLRSASEGLDSLPGSRGRLRWALLVPEVGTLYNSAIPFSLNDGALWAGHGWNMDMRAGLVARWRRLSLVLAPELLATENLGYALPPPQVQLPRPVGRSPFSTPWHVGTYSIDLPLRFGERGGLLVDFGQSTLAADLGAVTAGLSTENEWWGPGIKNAIVMSNNAAGIWRAFVRSRPLRTKVGTFTARYFLGGLFESPYFDQTEQDDRRSINGFAATWTPPHTNLTFGFARTVYAPLEVWPDIFGHAFDILRGRGWHREPGDTAPQASRDQLYSFFARWVFPEDHFAVHAEWARNQPPASLRELLVLPNHSQGYTLGLEWARPVRAGRDAVRFQAEVTYLEQSPAYRNVPEISWYTGAAAQQGYTQRGQVIGAAIGPGASSQWLALDYVMPRSRLGVFAGRIRWDDDALYLFPGTAIAENKWCSHDVSLFAGLSAAAQGRWGQARVAVTRGERLNVFFEHLTTCAHHPNEQFIRDARNTTLEIRFSPP